jgi:hypothetical protein
MAILRQIPGGAGLLGLAVCVLTMFSALSYAQEKIMLISKAQIEAAANRRVVFAHQSVGFNVLDGVSKIAKDNGAALRLVEGRGDVSGKPGIYHFAVGANGDPLGKISDFEKTLGVNGFENVDVALVKLCYVDFNVGSDAQGIAKTYVSTIKKLQEAHPQTRFVAVTAPLTVVRSGPKQWLKSALGRGTDDVADNAKRKEFNDALRKQFDAEHLFDIAKLEAGAGSDETEALRAEISSDGGHLNDKGEREIGAAFIQLIAGKS